MGIPALGIFGVDHLAKVPSKTIDNPQSIGEHIKKRRLELRLLQAEVANIFGVCEDSITGWENGRNEPQIRYYPKIIEFLRYNPFLLDETTLGGKIRKYRIEYGLSIKRLSQILSIEERTLISWEENRAQPKKDKYKKIKELIE